MLLFLSCHPERERRVFTRVSEILRRSTPQNDIHKHKTKKAPSVVGGRFDGIQIDRMNYKDKLSFFCCTETSPVPTTEVAEMGLRFDLASIRILALSRNILGGILLANREMSIV